MRAARKTLAILLSLIAALMLAVALTAPMIAATTPAVLTLGLAAAAFIAWPRRRKVEH